MYLYEVHIVYHKMCLWENNKKKIMSVLFPLFVGAHYY